MTGVVQEPIVGEVVEEASKVGTRLPFGSEPARQGKLRGKQPEEGQLKPVVGLVPLIEVKRHQVMSHNSSGTTPLTQGQSREEEVKE